MDKKTIKKREIIEKSINVIFEKGYNGAGVKDLANAAGIPKGSIYNYFENKEDYLKEVLKYYYAKSETEQFLILEDKSLMPLDRIRGFFNFMINGFEENDFSKGCFIGKITQEVSGSNEAIRELTEEIQNEIMKKIAKNIKEAKDNNQLNQAVNEDVLAEFIYDSWQGALIRIKATRKRETLDNFYSVLDGVLLK